MLLYVVMDMQHVLDRSQAEDLIRIDPRKLRANRVRARRKNQLVICLDKFFAGEQVADVNRMHIGVNGDRLMTRLHGNAESIPKSLGRLQRERRLLLNHAANKVWQSAIGIGHIARALENNNLRLLVKPAQARRGRCAAGNASHDNHLHG